MDVFKEDMKLVGVREEVEWRRMIHWKHSWKFKLKTEAGCEFTAYLPEFIELELNES